MRAIMLIGTFACGAAGAAFACSSSSETTTPASPSPDASTYSDAPSNPPPLPPAPTPTDGGSDATQGKDANGPGATGADCSFNRDCQLALRCECDQGTCTCQPGARGTGQSGIDACDSGNECASAVCIEGPGGAFLCTDECATPADCPTKLPLCEDIAFVGRICVRQP